MSLNRATFYDVLRHSSLFGGHLSVSQVEGMEAVLNEWEARDYTDLRCLAYMFGTIYWETDRTMQPIEERGKGKGYKYGNPDPITGLVYYGRGFVQLTWAKNYQTMGDHIGVDLYHHPELALQMDIATKILFEGMIRGMFTGRKLSDYFNSTTEDWVDARKIINGLDRAQTIANIAKEFYTALNEK